MWPPSHQRIKRDAMKTFPAGRSDVFQGVIIIDLSARIALSGSVIANPLRQQYFFSQFVAMLDCQRAPVF